MILPSGVIKKTNKKGNRKRRRKRGMSKSHKYEGWSNFEIMIFGEGTVMGGKLRFFDVMLGAYSMTITIIFTILLIWAWSTAYKALDKANSLDDGMAKRVEPMKKAISNTVAVYEIKDLKGRPGGYASLDDNGKIPSYQIPKITLANAVRPLSEDASIISSKKFADGVLKIFKPGKNMEFIETDTYIKMDCVCPNEQPA